MGDGELDQLSLSIGRLEGRFEAGITTLKEAVEILTEKMTGVVTAVHSHGERLDKVEPRLDALHEHHTGRTAVVKFLKALPYAAIGSGLGMVAAQWKSIIAPLVH